MGAKPENTGRVLAGNSAVWLFPFRAMKDVPLVSRAWKFIGRHYEYFLIPVFIFVVWSLWQLVKQYGHVPGYLVPGPAEVWHRFMGVQQNGSLWQNTRVTLLEAMLGFVASFFFATVVGYVLGKVSLVEKIVSPYLVAAQTVPLVALAPLFAVWFGYGLTSKVVITFVMVSFPMLVNTIVGLKAVSMEKRELMRSYSAAPWQVLVWLEVPSAIPILFAGVKIGITMSMAGAMVGEYVGSNEGLAFMLLHAKQNFDFPEVFVAIFVLAIIDIALFVGVSALEDLVLANRGREDNG
jgi:NitT/TauT family transport system permease protein